NLSEFKRVALRNPGPFTHSGPPPRPPSRGSGALRTPHSAFRTPHSKAVKEHCQYSNGQTHLRYSIYEKTPASKTSGLFSFQHCHLNNPRNRESVHGHRWHPGEETTPPNPFCQNVSDFPHAVSEM